MNRGERQLAWNPITRKIVRDGEWTYDIKPGTDSMANAAIGRKNAKNQREFWHRDNGKGEEIVQSLDGVKKVTSRFTSGKLAGATRKKEAIAHGVTKTIYQATYDEKGRLLRQTLENGEVNQYNYSPDSDSYTKTHLTKEGKMKAVSEYRGGKRVFVRSADGRTAEYSHDDLGREIKLILSGKLHSETSFDPNGKWKKVVVYDAESGALIGHFSLSMILEAGS